MLVPSAAFSLVNGDSPELGPGNLDSRTKAPMQRKIHSRELPSGAMPDSSVKPPKADIGRPAGNVAEVPCVDGAPLARVFFTFAAGRCGHVFDLLARFS